MYLFDCLGNACWGGANREVSHLDGALGLVKVEHDHPSAILQLDSCHVDGRKHVLESHLHEPDVGRRLVVAKVVENDLPVARRPERRRRNVLLD